MPVMLADLLCVCLTLTILQSKSTGLLDRTAVEWSAGVLRGVGGGRWCRRIAARFDDLGHIGPGSQNFARAISMRLQEPSHSGTIEKA